MSGYIGTQPVPQATQTRETFTATSGQTTFNTGGYTAGYIDVFLNGVKLAAADYTATNGSDVVLATGAATGDILETVAYTAFTVADQDFTGTTTTEDLTVTGAFTSQGIDDNATSTAMTLDSSGNLLVGSTELLPADNSIEGMTYRNGLSLQVFRDAGAPVVFGRGSSDGDVAVFSKDGTTVGSIGTFGGRIVFADSPSGVTIDDAANTFRTINASNGGARDGATDLGDASNRWKNLYLSGGVYLGGTGSANKLDDYEEGTWTPTIISDNATATLTGAGSYVKIGAMVHIRFSAYHVDLSALTNGSIRLGGLPFSTSGEQAFPIMIDTSDNSSQVWVWLGNSASAGYMKQSEFNNALTGAELSDTNDIYLSATYRTS